MEARAIILRAPVILLSCGVMDNGVIRVQVVGVIPTNRGCAVFVGNGEKTFTIYVETSVGQAISMFMQGISKERPLTHDMVGHIFTGLGVTIERVVINDLKKGTYFARLILKQENELGRKILEVDARPSDCLALAIQSKAPVFVARKVFNQVEDMTDLLKNLNEMQTQAVSGGGEAGDEEGGEEDSIAPDPDMDEPGPDEPAPDEGKV